MNPQRITKYKCPICEELHNSEFRAELCCTPEVEEVTLFKCTECEEVHDTEDAARQCCWDGEEVLLPTPRELEAAGQQRLAL